MSANVETMAYNRVEKPWHGLGVEVDESIGVDEMIKAAGLGWEVAAYPLHFERNGEIFAARDRVLVREDSGAILDTIGPQYTPTQNAEVFEFFRGYVEAGDMTLETAGSLQDGKWVWALAKIGEGFDLGDGDKILPYVLLLNPHQYAKALIVKATQVRAVCWNTVTAALRSGGAESRFWHKAEFNAAARGKIQEDLGIARERSEAFQKVAETLVGIKMDAEQVRAMAVKHFGGDDEKPSRTAGRVEDLYAGAGYGAGLPTARGTAWGFLNAVTQFVDHEKGRTQDARIANAWLGQGEAMKRKVMEDLVGLAG